MSQIKISELRRIKSNTNLL